MRSTQIPEHGGKAVPGADRQKAIALLRRRYGADAVLQLFLNGVQVVGGLGLAARRQIRRLGAHILDLGQLQRAVLLGLVQGVAGGVGVDVHLEGLIILADDQTVADAAQIAPPADGRWSCGR